MKNGKTEQTRIIDTTYYSVGFPEEQHDDIIIRSNHISAIEDLLDQNARVVFIEGDEGCGKTTICSQFAKKHSTTTISVFFNPLNKMDYDLEFFYSNVVDQIRYLLNEEEDGLNGGFVGIEEFNNSMFRLRRTLTKKVKHINLIIDGLDFKIKQDPSFVSSLIEIIPWGEKIVRVIIPGYRSDFVKIFPPINRDDVKSLQVTGLSSPEVMNFLGQGNESEIAELYKITKGYPGRLRTLKRLLKSESHSLATLSSSSTYLNWIEIDCAEAPLNDPLCNLLLSLIALQDNLYSIDQISAICEKSEEEIIDSFSELSFIDVREKFICFSSIEHKKYFSNVLRGNKTAITNLLTNYYARTETVESQIELPKLYASSNEWGKIVEMITDEYIQKLLENTGSLKVVNDSLELGVQASEKTNNYTDLWRYSFQGSIVNELDNYLFWESEIDARISIKDFTGAIALAETAVLKVDRLRLLALIARRQKQINNAVDEHLTSLIGELYKSTELHSIGHKIYDIVSDLIYALPNLAIEIIENSSTDDKDKNINDWITAKLSVAAIEFNTRESKSMESGKRLEEALTKNVPQIQKVSRAIAFLVGNYTPDKVLSEVRALNDPKERLRLIRLWLENNKGSAQDVDKIINSALDDVVASSNRSMMTLDILLELSNQLPWIKDKTSKTQLIKRFKAIDSDFQESGIKRNKYLYQLNIFHAQFSLNVDNSISIINQIIKEIDQVQDPLIKLETFAAVYSKLKFLNHDDLQKKIGFLHSRINLICDEILSNTADHFKVLENAIKYLAKTNPILGLRLVERMNTSLRREKGVTAVLESYLNNNIKYIKMDFLKEIESKLQYQYSKENFLFSVLERFSQPKALHFDVIKELQYFISKIYLIKSPSSRCEALILKYKIISKNDTWQRKLTKQIQTELFDSWSKIEADWQKIDQGFSLCSDIASLDPAFSKDFFTKTEEIKKSSWIDSRLVAYTYLNSLKLVIKSYTSLLLSDNNKPNDYEIIEDLIRRIPSEIEKLKLWTEFGINSNLIGKNDIAHKILDEHVLPLFQDLVNKHAEIEDTLNTLTFVHLYNPELVSTYINAIGNDLHDEVYSNIAHYYLTKQNPFEVYEGEVHKYNSSFSDISKALDVISKIKTDSFLYYQIKSICSAIAQNKSEFHASQISTLSEGINEIYNRSLPDSKNIKHIGYKILAELHFIRIKKGVDYSKLYNQFLNDINAVDNFSDKILVKTVFLDQFPFDKIQKGSEIRSSLYHEILNDLPKLLVHSEYVQRVIDLNDVMYKIDRKSWKQVVEKAFKISGEMEHGTEAYLSQKNIIDSMYRLDANYAKELMKLIDSKNRNKRISIMLNEHFESLEMSEKIKNNQTLEAHEKSNQRKLISGVLMALRSLNSDRLATKITKVSDICRYLIVSNKIPLRESFPVYAYYLGHCARTYKSKKLEGSVANIHRGNFEEAVKSTNLIELLSHKRKLYTNQVRKFFIDEEFSNKAVKQGSREEAITFIKKWMQDSLGEKLYFIDPYFKKGDLEILKLVKEINDDADVKILGCDGGWNANVESEMRQHWKKLSAQRPPNTHINFCWTPDNHNDPPIHDRWLLSDNSGLRLGTSLNSMGISKDSEISVMNAAQVTNIMENIVLEVIRGERREYKGLRLSYKGFSL